MSDAMTVRWDLSDLDKLADKMDEIRKKIELKVDEFANRLGQLGVRIASTYYSQAPYAGENDVEVHLEPGSQTGTVTIVAGGVAVLFIEFGTGVTMPDAHEARAELVKDSGIVYHGQYGKKKAANPKGWYVPFEWIPEDANLPDGTYVVGHYNRKRHRTEYYWKTRGNPAYPAMYMARNELIDNIASIAKEVFK